MIEVSAGQLVNKFPSPEISMIEPGMVSDSREVQSTKEPPRSMVTSYTEPSTDIVEGRVSSLAVVVTLMIVAFVPDKEYSMPSKVTVCCAVKWTIAITSEKRVNRMRCMKLIVMSQGPRKRQID